MEKYKYFLDDLVGLLKEKLENAHEDMLLKNTNSSKDRVFAFYETLDLIKSQAKVFGIPLSEIGLNNYNIEKFL